MKKVILLFVFIMIASIHGQSQSHDFEYDPTDYGKGNSVGLSLFGNGLGMTFKFAASGENQWEITPGYTARIIVNDINDDYEIEEYFHGISLTTGYNIFLGSKYKANNRKVIKNYMGLKGSAIYRGTSEVGLAFIWHREAFRSHQENYSRGLDLGLQFTHILDRGSYYYNDLDDSRVNIFFRIDWNWYK